MSEPAIDPQDKKFVGVIISIIFAAIITVPSFCLWNKYGKPWYEARGKTAQATTATATEVLGKNAYHIVYVHRSTNGTYIRSFVMNSDRMDEKALEEAARQIRKNDRTPAELIILNVIKLDPPK